MIRLAAGPRPTMQKHGRQSIRIPHLFKVEGVDVVHLQLLRAIRADLGVKVFHGAQV
jgi:hypothetical protein